jgi:hypothetical protein
MIVQSANISDFVLTTVTKDGVLITNSGKLNIITRVPDKLSAKYDSEPIQSYPKDRNSHLSY